MDPELTHNPVSDHKSKTAEGETTIKEYDTKDDKSEIARKERAVVERDHLPTATKVKNKEEEGETANDAVLIGENTGRTANAKGSKEVAKRGEGASWGILTKVQMAKEGETMVKERGQLTGETRGHYENTGQNRRRNHCKSNVTIIRADVERAERIKADGVVFTLTATH